jgi:hypothetical protein
MPTLNTTRGPSQLLTPVRSQHNRQVGMPVQDAVGQRWDGEEVHRNDGFTMIAQERKPAFRGFGVSRRFTHPAGDRSQSNAGNNELARVTGHQ